MRELYMKRQNRQQAEAALVDMMVLWAEVLTLGAVLMVICL